MISNIQKYSIHDGTGIRTNVFLKQCPLKCFWCANPENQYPGRELMYFENKCMQCYACVKVCPQWALTVGENGAVRCDRAKCVHCGMCERECVKDAIRISGKVYTTKEILDKVRRDEIFYQYGGGGLTVSGGEPLSCGAFCRELMEECSADCIGVTVESCGFGKTETLLAYARYAQRIYFDIKHFDPVKHKEATGVSNEVILENLHSLTGVYAHTVVRVPVIPFLNDTEEEMKGIARVIADTIGEKGIEYVELLPFHNLGSQKYKALDRENRLQGYRNMSKEHARTYIRFFEEAGLNCVVE